jgi:dihydroneopterin aldolase / 2-amino-4-hydroxy-6-hydroxymethyldihydropteridine diphosphokinase / dihydropteroate synthase
VVTVRAAKPKALVAADAAEVEIVRTSRDYPWATKVEESPPGEPSPLLALDPLFAPSPLSLLLASASQSQGKHLAAIALGSNLGDRFASIEAALRLLENPKFIISAADEAGTAPTLAVVNTSFLYETAPMYVTDQPSFLNCACIVRFFLNT